MGLWQRIWGPREQLPNELTQPYALIAAARNVKAIESGKSSIVPSYESWQEEAWDYYDSLGEFRFAVTWKAEMISRVRLRAGRMISGQDEPELLSDGAASEIISELGGGIGGQPELLDSLSVQLDVPGDGWLIGEAHAGKNTWHVRSLDEVRKRGSKWEVIDESSVMGNEKWRQLSDNSLTVRVWRPNKRRRHLADSPARAARATMRELELVNRHIQAQYLSRLASAGVFIMPDEVSFPVRPEFQDENDPFVLEWIETAREAISEPGTASSLIPIPMRVPAEYADKFKHIDFTLKLDEKIIEKRESAIRRLAYQVDVPAEVLLGMGDTNHWSSWQIEESAIKTHILPTVELIANALTIGYLHPRLKAAGESIDGIVVWYDTSELTFRPDRSDKAVMAYDRGELSGKALRRETGFDEADKPSTSELRDIGLKMLMKNPQVGLTALAELTDDNALRGTADEASGRPDVKNEIQDPAKKEDADGGPPDTRDDDKSTLPNGTNNAATKARILEQALAMHRISVNLDGWTLYHPELCGSHIFTCPVTEASRYLSHHPGTSGDYECWLSTSGDLVIGQRVYDVELSNFIAGHTRFFARKSTNDGRTK